MPTLSTDSARQTLVLRMLQAGLRLESGRSVDFLPDDRRIAVALQFAPTSTVIRSSSKHEEYWQAAERMAAIPVQRSRVWLAGKAKALAK